MKVRLCKRRRTLTCDTWLSLSTAMSLWEVMKKWNLNLICDCLLLDTLLLRVNLYSMWLSQKTMVFMKSDFIDSLTLTKVCKWLMITTVFNLQRVTTVFLRNKRLKTNLKCFRVSLSITMKWTRSIRMSVQPTTGIKFILSRVLLSKMKDSEGVTR